MAIAPVTMIASSISSTDGIDNPMGNGGENDGSHTVGSAKYFDVWAEECGEEE